jgi:ZIP family zinc transporter
MPILNAFLLSLVAGLAPGLGGVAVALLRRLEMRTYDALLGFAGGVMTAIATLGLALQAQREGPLLVALVGLAVGAAGLYFLDRLLPHEHLAIPEANASSYRLGMLLFAALALHNIPEGLAVGTSYAAQPRLGLVLALAIALHNIPEGVAVAGPLRASGMSARRYLAWTTASGLAEPIAAFLGAALVSLWAPILPFCMAAAGGAMLYVVSDELIPESHSHGFEHEATLGFILGFILVLGLSPLLQ